jgi:hypothetical protein
VSLELNVQTPAAADDVRGLDVMFGPTVHRQAHDPRYRVGFPGDYDGDEEALIAALKAELQRLASGLSERDADRLYYQILYDPDIFADLESPTRLEWPPVSLPIHGKIHQEGHPHVQADLAAVRILV